MQQQNLAIHRDNFSCETEPELTVHVQTILTEAGMTLQDCDQDLALEKDWEINLLALVIMIPIEPRDKPLG